MWLAGYSNMRILGNKTSIHSLRKIRGNNVFKRNRPQLEQKGEVKLVNSLKLQRFH